MSATFCYLTGPITIGFSKAGQLHRFVTARYGGDSFGTIPRGIRPLMYWSEAIVVTYHLALR